MKQNENFIKGTDELWNLLTLWMDDQIDDYSKDDIIEMVKNAWESVQ